MNIDWINPRDRLPVQDQLIWIIYDIMGGLYPSAECHIAKVTSLKYGILCAEEIKHKGEAKYRRYFTTWAPEDFYFRADHHNTIYAWAEYNESDLPAWDYLTQEESEELITSSEQYKKQMAIDEQDKKIEEATKGQIHFIILEDERPIRNGMYVVATKNYIVLLRYDVSLDCPWIVNGEPVIAWYPVPSHCKVKV